MEDIERLIQDGIRRNDFFSYLLTTIDRKIDENADALAYAKINPEKPSWVLCINPRMFQEIVQKTGVDPKVLLYTLLLHEFFHIARDHIVRGQLLQRSYSLFQLNVAADLAVNSTLPINCENTVRKVGGVLPDQFGYPNELSMEQYIELFFDSLKKDELFYVGGKEKSSKRDLKGQKSQENIYGKPLSKCGSSLLPNPDVTVSVEELERLIREQKKKESESGSQPQPGGTSQDTTEGDKPSFSMDNAASLATEALKKDLQKAFENYERIGIPIGDLARRARGIGTGSGGYEWLVDWIFPKVEISWKRLLKNTLMGNVRSREWYRTFRRNHPRADSGVLLKGKYPYKKEKVLVLLDTSGSMGSDDYEQFFGVLQSLKKDEISVFVAQWDYEKLHQAPLPMETYLKGKQASFRGGGGTDMTAGVLHVHKEYPDFRRVIVVTDGGTSYFTNEDPSPVAVIWVLTQYNEFPNADGIVINLQAKS